MARAHSTHMAKSPATTTSPPLHGRLTEARDEDGFDFHFLSTTATRLKREARLGFRRYFP